MMKHIIIVLIALVASQLSCRPVDHKVTVEDISNQRRAEGGDSTFGGHPFEFYLEHNQIPRVCKDLFNNVRRPSDDLDVLSLLDSMFTTNDETRPFYFFTITRTMSEADGAYAEPLGMMGKQFVETRTTDFIDYFKNERILTMNDLEEWAMVVAGEIQIAFEGHEKAETENLGSKMKASCFNCDGEQIKLIDDFVERVRYHCP